MALTGYQDWERVSKANGDLILNITAAISANTTYGPFNLQAWESLAISLFPSVGADTYLVIFGWYQESAGINEVSQSQVVVGPNNLLQIPVPVQGPWLYIFIYPLAGGNATAVRFAFYGQSGVPSSWQMNTWSNAPIFDETSYTANQTKSLQLNTSIYGKALLFVQPLSAALSYVMPQYFDFGSNSWRKYTRYDGATLANPVRDEIPMLAAPWRVQVVNGGTAQTIHTMVTPSEF